MAIAATAAYTPNIFYQRTDDEKLRNKNASVLLRNRPQAAKCHMYSKLCPPSILATDEVDKCIISAKDKVDVLCEAMPYIQKFRGKTVVVKWGGAVMASENLRDSVVTDVARLSGFGIRVVLVHGTGPEIRQWLTRLNIEPNFLNGLGFTDASTMDVESMDLVWKVNKDLAQLINNAGGSAIGLSGTDGGLLTAWPTPNASECGFVGEIESLNPTVLRPLVDSHHIPVIASLATDVMGQSYNICADTLAGELAAALGAEKLVLLSDVGGILADLDDPGSLVKEINAKGAEKMMGCGKINGGMMRKVGCCLKCLAQGIPSASIIDARLEHSLFLEILTDERAGTLITG